jgi:hypothetical protein
MLAFLWIFICLKIASPDVITFAEAFFTVCLFFILMGASYIADRIREIKLDRNYDRLVGSRTLEFNTQ